MIPSINELRLEEENQQLRLRIMELERKKFVVPVTAVPTKFDAEPVTELYPFIRVVGGSLFNHHQVEFMTKWELVGEAGFHQVVYKADYATFSPRACEYIIESMLRQCIHHIVNEAAKGV